MAKIYNEIVIDMNPESSTFEETLYEDSFEYSGDIMLMQGQEQIPDGTKVAVIENDEYVELKWSTATNEWKETGTDGQVVWAQIQNGLIKRYGSRQEAIDSESTGVSEYGAKTLTKADFINEDGSQKSPADVLAALKAAGAKGTNDVLLKNILEFMPKIEEIDKKDADYLAKTAALTGRTAQLTKRKADDAYGLGMSAVGRKEAGIEETYGLGRRAAGRGLEGQLGQFQAGAGKAGAQMRGAYGGMGGGMRGAIGAQATMAKGIGQTYGAYTDEQTRLTGARERGLGAVADERLGLDLDKYHADTAYDISMDTAALTEQKGLYGLEKGVTGAFETEISNIFEFEAPAYKKEGGRVKSKESFSSMLTKLPDAGGS